MAARNPSTPMNGTSTRMNGGESEKIVVNGATQEVEVICGPLINYKHLEAPDSHQPIWHGSILIVTRPTLGRPVLELSKSTDQTNGVTNGTGVNGTHGAGAASGTRSYEGVKLYADPTKVFFAFAISLPLGSHEAQWEYTIPNVGYASSALHRTHSRHQFFVPAAEESMRIMFHSCNGFSVGTDIEAYGGGPILWNDVLRNHANKPFHVMIGGGDQIYNDGIRVEGPLYEWTTIGNPHKRREYLFDESLRKDCDKYYFENYVKWYSTDPFGFANAKIPQLNIWDDHDIIDGFGSYTDHFMKCHVFRGIGGVACKYYCLFQHHIPPPQLSFVSDDPTTHLSKNTADLHANHPQLRDTYILPQDKFPVDPSFVLGLNPGPYVEDVSRSLYTRLGARIGFFGLDARMERTRHQVNYEETYDLVMKRLDSELRASEGRIRHLIVLLGVPIAYPRLVWLENILNSPLMGGIRFLNKRFGVAGDLFNKFDGQVDLLDDLDDHYTARHHKKERKRLMLRLQQVSRTHNVRVTILGGDVHLAAFGRFYSKPKLNIKPEHDFRYMANVISSAITNKPPPKAIANILARRNFIHHMDHDTDETLMNLFDKDPGNTVKTAATNHCTLPSRNYAIIAEAPVHEPPVNGTGTTNGTEAAVESNDFAAAHHVPTAVPAVTPKDGHEALTKGEENGGTKHIVADGVSSGELSGGLDVTYRIEIDSRDKEARTEGYGLSIPALWPAPLVSDQDSA